MTRIKSFLKGIFENLGLHIKKSDVSIKERLIAFKEEIINLLKSFIDFKNIRKNNLNLAIKFIQQGNIKDAELRLKIMRLFNKKDLDSIYYTACCNLLKNKPYTASIMLLSLEKGQGLYRDDSKLIFTKEKEVKELLALINEKKMDEAIEKCRQNINAVSGIELHKEDRDNIKSLPLKQSSSSKEEGFDKELMDLKE